MELKPASSLAFCTLLSIAASQAQEHTVIDTRQLLPGQRIEDLPEVERMVRTADAASYAAWKVGRAKQASATAQAPAEGKRPQPAEGGQAKGGLGTCDCWVEPTSNYTLINNATQWTATGFQNTDDGAYGPIQLPFSFYLYGQTWSTAYININGNVSFGQAYGTYNPEGFPVSGFTMVAPFWGDVDLGDVINNINQIKFKVTPTALYVNWINVGYYDSHTDKTNTFQLIISNGQDPVIPNGANVSFCYKDMQWTTGDASQGSGGFGGLPASVGANNGNGIDYLQFGQFDHAGTDYDGPYGSPDGVDWLDNQYFTFATDVTTGNVPPVLSGTSVCNYLAVCTDQPVNLQVSFISPEPDQITVAGSSAPGFPDYTITSNTSGQTANISTTFTPTVPGMYQVTFEGTDDGTPPMTSTLVINVEVFESPTGMPVIAGDLSACLGTGTVLSVPGDFQNYQWSNGYNGNTVLVGPGTYTVSAGSGTCLLTSDPVTVVGIPSPAPVISGVLFNCSGDPAVLSTTEPYAGYQWSNGAQTPTISVGTGSYSVQVTNAEGCSGTSAPVNVNSAQSPSAFFSVFPTDQVFPGTTVSYTGLGQGNNLTWHWTVAPLGTEGSGPTFEQLYLEPGQYVVTLTVTTPEGCTATWQYTQTVVPLEIVVPNVFSPNGDNTNDALTFSGAEFYPNTELKVFNRYGKTVFESGNYKNTWRAPDVPAGTYFYVLKLNTGKEYTGHVTLVR